LRSMKFEIPSEGREAITKKVRAWRLFPMWSWLRKTFCQYDELMQRMFEKFASVVDE
jgi:hypothetical protein